VLAIGEREDFGPIDFFTTLPAAWFETKLYFQDYLSMAVAIALMASAIIILISTIIFRKRIRARLQARAKLTRRHGIH
jgi:membrane protein implicated in regulation of membrane protease activity